REGDDDPHRAFGVGLRTNNSGIKGKKKYGQQSRQLHLRASWIVFHTRYGVAGISMSRTPSSHSASTIALVTAASAGVVPPSPPALMPSGLVGDSTSAISVRNEGSTSARGSG